jgi:hypothetical protein
MIIGNRNIQLKPNADLDDFFTFATVSNIPTIYGTGAYVRIGDAGTSNWASTEDDLFVSNVSEFRGYTYFNGLLNTVTDTKTFGWGTSFDNYLFWDIADANANSLWWKTPMGDATNVPAITIFNTIGNMYNVDAGLYDGITQPILSVMDKNGRYAYDTAYYSDAGAATPIIKKASEFGSSVVGDIVRITAGTNAIPGWYWITSVDSVNQVTLDRNWCTANVPSNGKGVIYHSFAVLSSEGICTRITDGAPSDSSVEIDRDGWLILDAGNNLLYGRSQSIWQHWTPDGGAPTFTGGVTIDSDSNKLTLGAGGDMTIWYDGTYGNIKTSDVSASDLKITTGAGKTIVLDNPVYNDVSILLSTAKAPSSSSPTWTSYLSSEVPAFSKTVTNTLYFTSQLPHGYKEGSDIEFHIHLVYPDGNSGNSTWQLTYSWANIDGTFGVATSVNATIVSPATQNYHQMAEIEDAINGAGKTISSVLLCSISRLGGDGGDNYDNDIYAVSADFHVQTDTIGSRTATVK